MSRRFNLDIRIFNEVTAIDAANKELEVVDLRAGRTYREIYDKLILSPGALPIKPAVPGLDSSPVFPMRNIQDTYAIQDFTDTLHHGKELAVGKGFIVIELAEKQAKRAIK